MTVMGTAKCKTRLFVGKGDGASGSSAMNDVRNVKHETRLLMLTHEDHGCYLMMTAHNRAVPVGMRDDGGQLNKDKR